MKVTNWCRNLAFSLVAAGIWVPGVVYAANIIPLGDPSFDDYDVAALSAHGGYAYSDEYRPTSAWVDDLDHAGGGYYEDDGNSNWLYTAAYGTGFRPAPRSGNQAMHGIGYYNAQVVSDTFEAGQTYKLSLWAQGDSDASGSSSRVWLYLFDGSEPFLESTSLQVQRFAPDTGDFTNRSIGASDDQSQLEWTQVSMFHEVAAGAPEIGQPIGVGFWQGDDGAVDDVTLEAGIYPDDFLVILEVDTTTGQATMKNLTGEAVALDYYEIVSAGNSLSDSGWLSLQDQNLAGFPAGDGSGNGWEQAGGSDPGVLAESYLMGNSNLADQAEISLGAAFDTGAGSQDLVFRYGVVAGSADLSADFDSDGDADGNDFLQWQLGLGIDYDGTDLAAWQSEFGSTGGPSGTSNLVTGYVRYVTPSSTAAVPEPSTLLLVGVGMAGLMTAGVRRKTFF
jgi:PEP-CTERM motif-containing protein